MFDTERPLRRSASGDSAPALLLAGLSVRALAQAARRAGFEAIGFDAFGDLDARAACRAMVPLSTEPARVDWEPVLRPYVAAARGVVYGSGFDDCPERLAAIARVAPIIGSPPEALARAKDPRGFALACAEAGLAHPEIAFAPPPDPANWLVKRRGGSGGAHIRVGAHALAFNEYAQWRVEGRSLSLLFVRGADALTPIAWSEQWAAPAHDALFRWGGAAGPVEGVASALPGLAALTAALGVCGLASADFLDDGRELWLLEINPRPGATLDLFDDPMDPLLARHIDACAGRPAAAALPRKPRAAAIVYAESDCVAPRFDWPDWAADRPAPGARIPRGAPICTVTAGNRAGAETRVAEMRYKFQQGAPWAAQRRSA